LSPQTTSETPTGTKNYGVCIKRVEERHGTIDQHGMVGYIAGKDEQFSFFHWDALLTMEEEGLLVGTEKDKDVSPVALALTCGPARVAKYMTCSVKTEELYTQSEPSASSIGSLLGPS
jgi:hypothetical protein